MAIASTRLLDAIPARLSSWVPDTRFVLSGMINAAGVRVPNHLVHRLRQKLSGFRGTLQADQPLAPVVWFRAGGPAEILAMPADVEDLQFLMRALPEEIPVTVIGLGSNLLVRDGGVDGVVVRLSARGFGKMEVSRETASAWARRWPTSASPRRPYEVGSVASHSITASPVASAARSA